MVRRQAKALASHPDIMWRTVLKRKASHLNANILYGTAVFVFSDYYLLKNISGWYGIFVSEDFLFV